MERAILEIVNDFAAWKGNSFTLASLVAEKQRDIDAQKVTEAGFPEAAEAI